MGKNTAAAQVPGYAIARAGRTAEINLYGEVVRTHPVDWWSGEKLPGCYICQDEFLAALEDLRDAEEITVHLNSVGGEFYVGLAICNRLRELPAKVTVINDALAASAGSIILQGADEGRRLVKRASNTMIHQAAYRLYGSYNQNDLAQVAKELEAHDNAMIQAYMARTNRTEEQVRADIAAETWMTGQEAVNLGYADAVEDGEAVPVAVSADLKVLQVNGRQVAARWLPGKLPVNVAVLETGEPNAPDPATSAGGADPDAPAHRAGEPDEPNSAPAAGGDNQHKGVKEMEIENLEQLREAFPKLVAQAEAQAVAADRKRLQDIDSVASQVADAALLAKARYGGENGDQPMTAAELALAIVQAQAKAGSAALEGMERDAKSSGADGVGAAVNQPGPGGGGPSSEAVAAADAKKAWEDYQAMKGGK